MCLVNESGNSGGWVYLRAAGALGGARSDGAGEYCPELFEASIVLVSSVGVGVGDGQSGMDREHTRPGRVEGRRKGTDIILSCLRDGSSINHADDGSENEEDG